MKRPATMASQIGFQSLDKSKPNKNKKVKKRSEFTNLLRSCVSKTKSRARNDSETTLPLTFVNKKKRKEKENDEKCSVFFPIRTADWRRWLVFWFYPQFLWFLFALKKTTSVWLKARSVVAVLLHVRFFCFFFAVNFISSLLFLPVLCVHHSSSSSSYFSSFSSFSSWSVRVFDSSLSLHEQ